MHLACSFGNIDCVRALLRFGGDVNLQDKSGNTPLILATRSNYPEIVQLLIESGADPRVEDQYGKSPIKRTKDLRIISMLQTCNNKKTKKKRSKSALIFDRLFYKFDQVAWEKSKLGIQISAKVKEKVNECNNSLTARLEALMIEQIEENFIKAKQSIVEAIKKWTFVYFMSFEQDLNGLVGELAKRKPPKIDLDELFVKAKGKANQKISKKIKGKIEKNIRTTVKNLIQEEFYAGKNQLMSEMQMEIRKKFSKLTESCIK